MKDTFSKVATRLAVGLATLVFTVAAGHAYAQGGKKVINAQTITTYPPFEFKDPATGRLTGLDIEILEALAAKMGAEVHWTDTSFAILSSFAPLKTKRADVLISALTDTPERRVHADFLDYVYSPMVIYTLRMHADQYPNMDAFCGKRVSGSRTSVVEQEAITKWSEENCSKAGKPPVILTLGETTPDIRLMLRQGRTDAALVAEGVLAYTNTQEGNIFVRVGKPLLKAIFGMAYSKDDPQLGQALKKALAAIIADGTYTRILRKWGLSDEAAIGQPMVNGQP